jgi:ADP-ribosyl-[dinitrogen reductase] hydrolase
MKIISLAETARGALLGLAIADALGTTLEFQARDSYSPLKDIVGGGPFNLQPGEWTDDTAMAIALAECLLEHEGLNERDLMERFCEWYDQGTYSCTGSCFDIGQTTLAALRRFRRTGDPMAGSEDPKHAGNGSLMRLAPVPILYWNNASARANAARNQSRTTHATREAVDACAAFADLIADAIDGTPRDILLTAALWATGGATSFAGTVLRAANLGDDADTTAAIAGQLAGAIYGASAIPTRWLDILAWRDHLESLADRLFDQSLALVPQPD